MERNDYILYMNKLLEILLRVMVLLFICLMKKASLIIIESWKVSSRLFILITSFLIPTRPIILLLFANWLDRWVGMPR